MVFCFLACVPCLQCCRHKGRRVGVRGPRVCWVRGSGGSEVPSVRVDPMSEGLGSGVWWVQGQVCLRSCGSGIWVGGRDMFKLQQKKHIVHMQGPEKVGAVWGQRSEGFVARALSRPCRREHPGLSGRLPVPSRLFDAGKKNLISTGSV